MKYAIVKDAVGNINEIAIFCDNQILNAEYTEVSFSEWETARHYITDLSQLKTHICNHIDCMAGNVRLKYITDVPGQQVTYQLKSEEAKEISRLGLVDGASLLLYPMIQAEMNATGLPMSTVVAQILGMEAGWRQLAATIEMVRRKYKINVNNAIDITSALTEETYAVNAFSLL